MLKLTLIWSIPFFKKLVTSIKFLAIFMYPSWPMARRVAQEAAIVPPAQAETDTDVLVWDQ